MLHKDESGVAKIKIPSKKTVMIPFNKLTSFKDDDAGWNEHISQIRIWFPRAGCPTTIRTRFVRYPGTPKHDETGHVSHPVPSSWAGRDEHIHFAHSFNTDSKMPYGVSIWHDGKNDIILDGRQLKSKKTAE